MVEISLQRRSYCQIEESAFVALVELLNEFSHPSIGEPIADRVERLHRELLEALPGEPPGIPVAPRVAGVVADAVLAERRRVAVLLTPVVRR